MDKYFKLIGKDTTNRGFKYHLGLNVDPHPFNTDVTDECGAGGIYFSTSTDIMNHLVPAHEWLAELMVPENVPVVNFKDNSRAHQVCINKFYELSKVSTWKYLVKTGADIHAFDDEALRWAARSGHLSVVKYLVKNGADINTYNGYVLQTAAGCGYLSVVKYLVENGANIHANDGCALLWAAMYDRRSVVKYLKGLK